MKAALDLVCSCLADTGAPEPYQRQLRVNRGRMTGYGGEVAVSAPVIADFDGALLPDRLKEFYTQERKGERFSVREGILTIKAGDRTVKAHLAANPDLPFLDVIGEELPLTCDWDEDKIKQLKHLLGICDPLLDRTLYQGVTFDGGSVYATNGKLFFAGSSGLDPSISVCITQRALLVVLRAAQISPLVSVAFDPGVAIAFIFEDTTRVICRYVETDLPAVLDQYFLTDEDDHYVTFTESGKAEVMKSKECTWLGQAGTSTLYQGAYIDGGPYHALGAVDNAVQHDCATCFMFASDVLQKALLFATEFRLHRPSNAPADSDCSWSILAFGADFAFIGMGRRDRGDSFTTELTQHAD